MIDTLPADRIAASTLWPDALPISREETLRRATQSDVPTIIGMRQEASQVLSGMPGTNRQWQDGTFYSGAEDESFRTVVQEGIQRGHTYIVERLGEAAATFTASFQGEEFLWPEDGVSALYLSRLMRRGFGERKFSGIGETALGAAHNMARRLGMQVIRLSAWEGNKGQAEYYEAQGFSRVKGPRFGSYPATQLMQRAVKYNSFANFDSRFAKSVEDTINSVPTSFHSYYPINACVGEWKRGEIPVLLAPSVLRNRLYDHDGTPREGLTDYLTPDEYVSLAKTFGHGALLCMITPDQSLQVVRSEAPIISERNLRDTINGGLAPYNPNIPLKFYGRFIIGGGESYIILPDDGSRVVWPNSPNLRIFDLSKDGIRRERGEPIHEQDYGWCQASLRFLATNANNGYYYLPPETMTHGEITLVD
ncbi:MAG TPA: hypothetical protein VLF60_05625 [Candidatus Saccharimonadales bacterium]|nr:hypothetical protein [Candidatus Saccharimonadales bacterium]